MRVTSLFSLRPFRPSVPREVEEELHFHLAMRIRELEARGLSRSEARQEALRRFGDLEAIAAACRTYGHKRERKVRRLHVLSELHQDFRHALRQFARARGFAAFTVLTLGLGIGAATAMFSAVDAALLRPLPFARPDRLVSLPVVTVPFRWNGPEQDRGERRYVDILDVGAMTGVFTHVAAYAAGGLNLSDAERPQRVNVGVVTADYFHTLGVAPIVGRGFAPEDGEPDAPHVVILSYGLWQQRFGGTDVGDLTVPLNGAAYEVIGVMPRGFSFPGSSDLWIPLSVPTTAASFEPFRGYLPSHVVARLADGVSVEAAASQMMAQWERIAGPRGEEQHSNLDEIIEQAVRQSGAARPLQAGLAASRRTGLLLLLGATGLVLLIACANVTNLMLSRAAVRRREIAVRSVLGATPTRLVRQLLTESAALALGAAGVGLAVAPALVRAISALTPQSLVGVAAPRLDLRVLAFAVALAASCAMGFGLWPALTLPRGAEGEAIKTGGGRGATAAGAGWVRRTLVGLELALTMVLTVAAGLMLHSLAQVMHTDLGLRTNGVATLKMTYVRTEVAHTVLDQLAAEPGIEAAGVVNDLPLAGEGGIGLRVTPTEGAPDGAPERTYARYLHATDGYFRALGIPLLRGRLLTRTDVASGEQVAVINATMARRLWGSRDPLDHTFTAGGESSPYRVIGVVGDVRESPEGEVSAQMYLPPSGERQRHLALVARGDLRPAALLSRMRDAVRHADPSQAVYQLRMLDDVLGTAVAPRRTNTLLITGFATMALLVAALGVYGVVSYSVAQRTPELGIRAALGATGGNLVTLVSRQVLGVAALGLGLGWLAAWGASRVLESLLYEVQPRDTAAFIAAPALLLFIVLAGTLWPARRALRLDPMDVIRTE